MELKGAPAYFQRMIATVVLLGSIHMICESYIDDVCVIAQLENEFISRLEQVFARFEKHNIALKPSKCTFGATEIEWLGRVIISEDISMSKDKLNSGLSFRKPTRYKELKSFIGLCEYFHINVRDFSAIMKLLHDLMQGYKKENCTRNRTVK
jgi:hypothetical protein